MGVLYEVRGGVQQEAESFAVHTLTGILHDVASIDELAQEMGNSIISDLQTLMDVTEYPEDYRE